MDGVVDLGLVGENVLEEARLERIATDSVAAYQPLRGLEFGQCRLSLAVPRESQYQSLKDLDGLRVATTYPQLLKRYLKDNGVNARTVMLTGSVEVAPRAGLAEAICDLVSTGATLCANGAGKQIHYAARSKEQIRASGRVITRCRNTHHFAA